MIYREEREPTRSPGVQPAQSPASKPGAGRIDEDALDQDPQLLDYEQIPDDEVAPEWRRRQG